MTKNTLRNLVTVFAISLGVCGFAADTGKKSKKPDAAEKYAQEMEK